MHQSLPQLGEWGSYAELHALQEKQIPEVLHRAAASPFYAARFADPESSASVGDFAGQPLTTKDDLHRAYPLGLLAVPMEEMANYFESSGSGGNPTPAYYTEEDWQDLVERYARKVCGINPSDVFFVRSPYALGLAAHLAAGAGRFRGATVLPGDNRSSVIPYPRVVRVLHDLKVTLTWSNPTDCLIWAAAARHAGLDPRTDFPALRALFVGGEPLSPARRRRISEIWGVPVIDEYGCTEVGSLAGRCSEDRLHFWADRVKPEIYDPETGALRDYGVGELVLTPLYLQAMPLIRYNIHDRVELAESDCACGWNLPTIEILGRSGMGYPVGEHRITQFQLENVVFSLPVELNVLFWRARAERDRLYIQVEAEDASVAELLVAAVAAELAVPAEVEVLPLGSLVPENQLVGTRQSLKPRSLYGPGESWDQAIVFSAS